MLPYFPFGAHFNTKIGTVPLTQDDPLVEVDEHYLAEVRLKRSLLEQCPQYYMQSIPESVSAQWEVVEQVLLQLVRFWPASFSLRQAGQEWTWGNRLLNERVTFRPGDLASLPLLPLDWVGRQVQEDLLLLAGPDATLIAGQLCFGNGWSLDEKMGLPFWTIHAPVTDIVEPMMRAAQKVMERLPPGRPLSRLNWSIKTSDQLDMSSRHTPALLAELAGKLTTLRTETIGSQLFLRIERQTLTRLPRSGAILFGVHTYQNRLDHELSQRPDATQRLLNVLKSTPEALLVYKGIKPFLTPLLEYLDEY